MSTESWAVAAPQTIDVEQVGEVTLRLQGGRAEVVADPGATGVRLEVIEVGDKPLQVTHDGSRLRVAYESSWLDTARSRVKSLRHNERAVVRVSLPPESAVDVGTVEAEVDVSGGRKVAVRTVNGAIRTAGTTGPMSLKTVAGAVSADDHRGDLSASVVSASLSVAGALGRVSTTSVSGATTVSAAPGSAPMVSAKTVSGALDFRLEPGTPVNVKVRGAAGQVVLDGSVLPSSGATLVVDHAEPNQDGRPAAYLSATVTSAHVTISRR